MTLKNPSLDFEAWLRLTIEQLHKALEQYHIGNPHGRLWQSIAGEIMRTGEDIEQILVKFARYGRFIDMGVGRGIPRGNRRNLGNEEFLKNVIKKGSYIATAAPQNHGLVKQKREK